MEKVELSDVEKEILYMCDDGLGLVELIVGKFKISINEAKEILNKLEEKGLLCHDEFKEKDFDLYIKDEKVKESMLKHGPSYETTSLGKEFLKTIRQI